MKVKSGWHSYHSGIHASGQTLTSSATVRTDLDIDWFHCILIIIDWFQYILTWTIIDWFHYLLTWTIGWFHYILTWTLTGSTTY
jgi:hypothetical protein